MMTTTETAEAAETRTRGRLAGRSELTVAVLLFAIAGYLAFGIATMEVPEGATAPGPRFFPSLIAVAIAVLGIVLAIGVLRSPPEAPSGEYRFHSDWRSLGLVIGGFLAFAVLLVPLGWILSAALLFWVVAHALGSRRRLLDIGLSLVFSSAIQFAFSAGLGLTLPGGIFEGIYS
jgi:putative tricarboxylic transport membrane protein